jgi:amidase
MRGLFILLLFLSGTSYSQSTDTTKLINAKHPNPRMRFHTVKSYYNDINKWLTPFAREIAALSKERYAILESLILEKDIPTLQASVAAKQFTYEELTLFYLRRIKEREGNPETALNALISIKPDCLREAHLCDSLRPTLEEVPLLFGMPILVKDNINTTGLPTTAGAEVLRNHRPANAFIITQLKKDGAIILGKANLSEWAYFFCGFCPLGYSALGGQTINPYGPMEFESGGSSSGSAVAVAANYAVAAIGTETSGSILSPSNLNSVVGLKPTVGNLSRNGIIPISEMLDTPGPMTKNTIDNAILYNAMIGLDSKDARSIQTSAIDIEEMKNGDLKGVKIAFFESYKNDTLYQSAKKVLSDLGAELISFTPNSGPLTGFISLLSIDMKYSLPVYLNQFADEKVTVRSVQDIIEYNKLDIEKRAPYGQQQFDLILTDTTSDDAFKVLQSDLKEKGMNYFKPAWDAGAIVMVGLNNFQAAQAAVAHAPCLAVPLGYKPDGQPAGLTFIGPSNSESVLYLVAHAFEKAHSIRKMPK